MSTKDNTLVFEISSKLSNGVQVVFLEIPDSTSENYHVLRKDGLKKFKDAITNKSYTAFSINWESVSNYVAFPEEKKRAPLTSLLGSIYYMDFGSGPIAGSGGKPLSDSISFQAMATNANLTRLDQWIAQTNLVDKIGDLPGSQVPKPP